MHSVKGHYKDGVAIPIEPVEVSLESDVIITFIDVNLEEEKSMTPEGWAYLRKIMREGARHTGISDLAHEHDHYLHGTPKRGTDDTR